MRYVTLFAASLLSISLWAQAPAPKPAAAPKPVPAKPEAKPTSSRSDVKGEVPMGKPPGRHYPVSKNQQTLDLKIHVKGLTGGEILLAHYYANQNSVLDTGIVDANGNCHFQADTAAPGGIYLVVLPSKRHFEIILAEEQKFSIDIPDTNKIVETIKITGSKENIAFYEHQRFMNDAGKKVEPLHAALQKAKAGNKKDSVALLTKQISAIDSSVKAYKKEYKVKYPNSFMAKVIAFMEEPEQIPLDKCPLKANGTIDSSYNYWNYRRHYWDGMDFTDERLLRTPIYYNKMKFWVDKILPQHPDSLAIHVNLLLDQCYKNDELYHYNVSYLTYYYESSKIMGFDAVFVAIVENNHAKGKCWWISEETNTKIVNQARKVKYGLMGNQAVNLFLQDSSGKLVELGKVKADYTIVVFWDPTCGHCKTEIPAIKLYYDSLRAAGVSVEVYAIYSELDYPEWRKYIREHKHTWKDVCAKDEQQLAEAKFYYNAIVTPTLYVLDANKKIIAKKLDDKGLKTVLNRRIEMDRKK